MKFLLPLVIWQCQPTFQSIGEVMACVLNLLCGRVCVYHKALLPPNWNRIFSVGCRKTADWQNKGSVSKPVDCQWVMIVTGLF